MSEESFKAIFAGTILHFCIQNGGQLKGFPHTSACQFNFCQNLKLSSAGCFRTVRQYNPEKKYFVYFYWLLISNLSVFRFSQSGLIDYGKINWGLVSNDNETERASECPEVTCQRLGLGDTHTEVRIASFIRCNDAGAKFILLDRIRIKDLYDSMTWFAIPKHTSVSASYPVSFSKKVQKFAWK